MEEAAAELDSVQNEISLLKESDDQTRRRAMTITDLDTGDEYLIGESDPDFEYDTFELRGSETVDSMPTSALTATADVRKGSGWGEAIWGALGGFLSSSSSPATSSNKTVAVSPTIHATSSVRTPFTKLSSFKFRKELGRGAFGRVLLAEAKTDGSLYALKIISKKNMRSSDRRQAKAERDILHAMGHTAPHPFTTGLKFAFQSENNLYLGMTYIPGGTLRELIKRQSALPEPWVRFYSSELVLAISHLHSLHVLYRDIKPHNVMLDAKGHIQIIDFGLSKQEIDHPRGAMSLVGTPDYSAPEVLKTGVHQLEASKRARDGHAGRGTGVVEVVGDNTTAQGEVVDQRKGKSTTVRPEQGSKYHPSIGYGRAADWWSLGVMIYEMLSGTPAFRGADLRQTYQRVLFADLEFRPEEAFSPAARSLLTGLLQRDPFLRLGSTSNPPKDIMNHNFFAGVNWEAVYAKSTKPPVLPTPSFRRKTTKTDVCDAVHEPSPVEALDVTKSASQRSRQIIKSDNPSAVSTHSENEDLLHVRDSIIMVGPAGHRLEDWSFVDENVLVAAAGSFK